MTHLEPADRLARAVRALMLGERLRHARPPHPPSTDAATRLDAVERDVQEVRTRVNALFFAVLTAGVADVVARMVLR